MNALDLLGKKVTDRVTGFEGVVTGVAVYLAGCHQACVWPRVGADGKVTEAVWLDCARLSPSQDPALTLPSVTVGTGGDGPRAPTR